MPHPRSVIAAMAVLFLASAEQARSDVLSGPITYVRDGDTLEIDGQAVRLRGVTCDETGPLARAATGRVAPMIGQWAICTLNGEQTGDRLVGWCSVSGQDLGALLISEGLCGRCARYDPQGMYRRLAARVVWRGDVPGYCRVRR